MTDTLSKLDDRALHGPMTDRLTTLGLSLTSEQWCAPSLCDGWRACDVYGHMTWSDNDLGAALDAAVRTETPLIAPAKSASGLHFVATDFDWSYGPTDGPEVTGPAEDLLLAMCGRPVGLITLRGDGVAVSRLPLGLSHADRL